MNAAARVLHVTECYDAGAGAAINAYVRNTPNLEHHLLYSGTMDPSLHPFTSSRRLPPGLLQRARSALNTARSLEPDVVHAHSSWAGVYARMFTMPAPVIYQPHCLSYESPGRSMIERVVFRQAEKTLARKTTSFVALTAHERTLLEQLARGIDVRTITNIPSVSEAMRDQWSFGRSRNVVMSGRVALQKDPEFFAMAARQARSMDESLTFRWLGDGDPALTRQLVDAGVEITGWLSPDEVALELTGAAVYLHSASYEGFPLSVLDACRIGTPIIVRDIAAFAGSGLSSVASVQQAAELAVKIAGSRAASEAAICAATALTELSTDRRQAAGLLELYSAACGRDVTDRVRQVTLKTLPSPRSPHEATARTGAKITRPQPATGQAQ